MKTKSIQSLEKIITKSIYYYVNSNLNSTNFPMPKNIRTEGWKLIKMKGSFSSQALDEIKRQGCTPANVYELALWSESHCQEIKKGTYVIAFGQLWQDSDGYRRVPCVGADSAGDFRFNLGYFEDDWYGDSCLLCFCDLPELGTLDTSENNSDTLNLKPSEYVNIPRAWFERLVHFQKRYEENPTIEKLNILFGYMSSAEFISKNL